MIFGYIRVSKTTQNLNLQEDALRNFNCDKIFFEKESGVKFRKEWENLYTQLRSGDTIVIWKIDRLGRTSWELIKLMAELSDRNIRFISTTEGVDTATPMGKLWFQLNAILAENERTVLKERTLAGLKAAAERGNKGGRPRGLSQEAIFKAKAVKELYKSKMSISDIRKTLKIGSNSTVYSYLNF